MIVVISGLSFSLGILYDAYLRYVVVFLVGLWFEISRRGFYICCGLCKLIVVVFEIGCGLDRFANFVIASSSLPERNLFHRGKNDLLFWHPLQ